MPGYTPPPAPVLPEINWNDKLGYYDFREWAEPNDDAINSGVLLYGTALAEIDAAGGPKRIYFPPGEWWGLTRFIVRGDSLTGVEHHNVEIFGAGIDQTILKAGPANNNSLFIVENSHYFKMHDLTLDGMASTRPAASAFNFTASATTVNVANDRILVDGETNNNLASLMLVQFSGADLPDGISPGVSYWARDVSAAGFKLSLTAEGAYVAINDTGSGTVTVTPVGEAAQPGGAAGDNFRVKWNGGVNGGVQGLCESPMVWNVLSRNQPHKDIGSFVFNESRNGWAHNLIVESGDRSPFAFGACEGFTARGLHAHQSRDSGPTNYNLMDDNLFVYGCKRMDLEVISHMPYVKQGRNVYITDSEQVAVRVVGDGGFRGNVVIEGSPGGTGCEDITVELVAKDGGAASTGGSAQEEYGSGVELNAGDGAAVRHVRVRGIITRPQRAAVRLGNPLGGSTAGGLIEDVEFEIESEYDQAATHAIAPYSAGITNHDFQTGNPSPTPMRNIRIVRPVLRGFRRGGIDFRGALVEDLSIIDPDIRDCGNAADAFDCVGIRLEDVVNPRVIGGIDRGAEHDFGLWMDGCTGEVVVDGYDPSSGSIVHGGTLPTRLHVDCLGWDPWEGEITLNPDGTWGWTAGTGHSYRSLSAVSFDPDFPAGAAPTVELYLAMPASAGSGIGVVATGVTVSGFTPRLWAPTGTVPIPQNGILRWRARPRV